MRIHYWILWLLIALFLPYPACANYYFNPNFPFYPSPLDQREKILFEPPGNEFSFEVKKLADKIPDKFIPVEGEELIGRNLTTRNDIARKDMESQNLSPAQLADLKVANAAKDGDTAFAAGKNLPPTVRAYTAGAVAFNSNDLKGAISRFSGAQVAQGPAAYKVMSVYMLGRAFAKLGATDKGCDFFSLTRDMVLKGAPDPLGLAAASYGEEARILLDQAGGVLGEPQFKPNQIIRLRKFHEAIKFYALQVQTGSQNGLNSLHILGKDIKNVPSDFTLLMKDEMARRLFLAYIRGYIGPLDGIQERAEFITSLLPLFPLKDEDISQQLAAAAYEIGNYDLARAYSSQKESAYSTWVEAKLALRRGDQERAASLYESALQQEQTESSNPSVDLDGEMLENERAVATLARGQYVKSFEESYRLENDNGTYLAARILTVNELQSFIDKNVPLSATVQPLESPNTLPKELSRKFGEAMYAVGIRNVLARRLMRIGKYHEALPYFPDWGIKETTPYITWLDAANSASDPIDKAEALFQAAKIERESGATFFGEELVYLAGADKDSTGNPFVTDGERERMAASRAETTLPFSFRKIAAREANQAADFLPPKSQAFAATLCHAVGWVRPADISESDRYYARYVKHGAIVPWATHFGHSCPQPNFFAAKHFEFIRAFKWIRRIFIRHRIVLALCWGIVFSLAFARSIYRLFWRRRFLAS